MSWVFQFSSDIPGCPKFIFYKLRDIARKVLSAAGLEGYREPSKYGYLVLTFNQKGYFYDKTGLSVWINSKADLLTRN